MVILLQMYIVGGGFSGVATVWNFAKGYKVALVEANRIGWGASGRNGGQIIGGYGSNPLLLNRRLEARVLKSLRRWARNALKLLARIEKYEIDCDLKWGYCELD